MTNQYHAAARFRFSIQPFSFLQYLKIAHKIFYFNRGKHSQQYDHTVNRDYDHTLMSQSDPFKKHRHNLQKAIISPSLSFSRINQQKVAKGDQQRVTNKGWRVGVDEGASLTGGWGVYAGKATHFNCRRTLGNAR